MNFQFDPSKANINKRKHNVSFAEAETVFYDPLAIHQKDMHSEGESRFIAVGAGGTGQILVVIYTYRNDDIRLISARYATRKEIKFYEG